MSEQSPFPSPEKDFGAVVDLLKRDQELRTFLEFTRRFDEISRDFPAEFRVGDGMGLPTAGMRQEELDKLMIACLRYFNLCSEEHCLHCKGFVSDDVWSIWEKHMSWAFRTPVFSKAWSELKSQFDAYPDFQAFVEGSLR